MARFCHLYPGLYVNAAWPTRDRVIPWRLYAALSGAGGAMASFRRLLDANAVATGIAMAMSDKGKEVATRLSREAFPETRG